MLDINMIIPILACIYPTALSDVYRQPRNSLSNGTLLSSLGYLALFTTKGSIAVENKVGT